MTHATARIGTNATSRTLSCSAVTKWPCTRTSTARVAPQPGQLMPVKAWSGQGGTEIRPWGPMMPANVAAPAAATAPAAARGATAGRGERINRSGRRVNRPGHDEEDDPADEQHHAHPSEDDAGQGQPPSAFPALRTV